MPIYEYNCPSCHKVFEEWVTSHDTGPQPCPMCGASAQHIVSQTTFVLKGGGWYVTEYGNRKSGQDGAAAPLATGSDAPNAVPAADGSTAPASDAGATGSSAAPAAAGTPGGAAPAASGQTSGQTSGQAAGQAAGKPAGASASGSEVAA